MGQENGKRMGILGSPKPTAYDNIVYFKRYPAFGGFLWFILRAGGVLHPVMFHCFNEQRCSLIAVIGPCGFAPRDMIGEHGAKCCIPTTEHWASRSSSIVLLSFEKQ